MLSLVQSKPKLKSKPPSKPVLEEEEEFDPDNPPAPTIRNKRPQERADPLLQDRGRPRDVDYESDSDTHAKKKKEKRKKHVERHLDSDGRSDTNNSSERSAKKHKSKKHKRSTKEGSEDGGGGRERAKVSYVEEKIEHDSDFASGAEEEDRRGESPKRKCLDVDGSDISIAAILAAAAIKTREYVIEKILGWRVHQSSVPSERSSMHVGPANSGTMYVEEELYFIKWKGLSYLHSSWERETDLEKFDAQTKHKVKRFRLQMEAEHGSQWRQVLMDEEEALAGEREYYNPGNIEVQRVIACSATFVAHEAELRTARHKLFTSGETMDAATEGAAVGGEEVVSAAHPEDDVQYLVKWAALGYDLCTWEKFADIKYYSDEILAYWDHQRPPRSVTNPRVYDAEYRARRRPALQLYKKYSESPVFGVSAAEVAAMEGEISKSVDTSAGLVLRDYQLEGLNWLLWNWWNGRSSILADEMGLGKTIQTTAFLDCLYRSGHHETRGPFLIVAPLSLVTQWQSEMSIWSPDLNVIVYHGNADGRQVIRQYEWWYEPPFVMKEASAQYKKSGATKFNVMITTFEIALKEAKELSRIPWKALIVDEAHRLKNHESRLFQELLSLPREHCLLLTGTPLQNKTEELWALLHFCDPKYFSDQGKFLDEFGSLKDQAQIKSLHTLLKPYLLRRVKENVEKALPPKEETIIEVSLTPVQRQFYRAIYEKNTSCLFKGARPSNAPSLMNVMMELRKCCNHPYLNRGVEERLLSEIPPELQTIGNLNKQLIDASGKMVLLAKLLPRLKAEGHKVLIFSQMVKCLDLIEEFLKTSAFSYERLDGSTKSNIRTAAVERFNRPHFNRFVMLLSTRAGGLGLNLTSADTVIIYDSDWNPQNDLQAQARAHRIGQTRPVSVYRLLTKKTYEMHMFHQASMKLGLDKALLKGQEDHEQVRGKEGSEPPSAQDSYKNDLKADEIDHLLKKGAYDVFRDDDQESKDFVELDIDAIMANAHKVNYDKATSATASLSSGFSKASFVSTDQKDEVDLDDPDFWRKAIGLVEEVKEPEAPIVPTPRPRKRARADTGPGSNTDGGEKKEPVEADGTGTSKSTSKSHQGRSKEAVKKEWGTHSRDRCMRNLLAYGYGRWNIIRSEAGQARIRDLEEIELFGRHTMLVLGLYAFEEERNNIAAAAESGKPVSKPIKDENQFVRDAVNTATMTVQHHATSGEPLEIPPIFQEARFREKMIKNYTARKHLFRLGILSKMNIIISNAAVSVMEKLPPEERAELAQAPDLDTQVSSLVPHNIAGSLDLPHLAYPRKEKPAPWWDEEAERDLILGTFLHGFASYPRMAADERLCFKRKSDAYKASQAHTSSSVINEDGNTLGSSNVVTSPGESSSILDRGGDLWRRNSPSPVHSQLQQPGLPTAEFKLPTIGGIGKSPPKQHTHVHAHAQPDDMNITSGSEDEFGSDARKSPPPLKDTNTPTLTHTHSFIKDSGTLSLSPENSGAPAGGVVSGEKKAEAILPDAKILTKLVEHILTFDAKTMKKAPSGVKDRKARWAEERAPIEPIPQVHERDSHGKFCSKDRAGTAVDASDTKEKVKRKSKKRVKEEEFAENEGIEDSGTSNQGPGPAAPGGVTSVHRKRYTLVDRAESAAIVQLLAWVDAGESTETIAEWQAKRKAPSHSGVAVSPTAAVQGVPLAYSGAAWGDAEERKLLCASLLAIGAPGGPEGSVTVHKDLLFEMNRLVPEVMRDGHEIDGKGYTWEDLLKRAGIKRTAVEVSSYYSRKFLPLCVELCHPNAAKAEDPEDDDASFFPDPELPVNKHNAVSRGVAYIYLKRLQLSRAIRHVLKVHSSAVLQYLRSEEALDTAHPQTAKDYVTYDSVLEPLSSTSQFGDLPLWWCPWIHDFAVLVGCVKHGLVNINAMRADAALPLSYEAIKQFVQEELLEVGEDGVHRLKGIKGVEQVGDADSMDIWVDQLCRQFPQRHAIEERVYRIMVEMTKNYPTVNPLRIR